MLETAVRELKQTIVEHDGANAADRAFAGRVDELIGVFYDDIGEITTVPTRTLFDLFVMKVLYVERRSTDAGIVEYLGGLLDRFVRAGELFLTDEDGRPRLAYFSDLVRDAARPRSLDTLCEAYRRYGDSSLFVSGMFPQTLRRRRRGRVPGATTFVDRSYYVSTGKRSYRLAARHVEAEEARQRALLEKLAAYFEIYLEALNEMSSRYILGFDMTLIADKMLDAFNRYRESRNERDLQHARRYAAILQLDPAALPSAS